MIYPPGPTNFNAWIGLTWRHGYRLWSEPLAFTRELAREYGDVVFYRVFHHLVYQINHPDLIRDILITRAKSFVRSQWINDIYKGYIGEGVFTMDGDAWKRQRRIVQPAFALAGAEQMRRVAVEETQSLAERWREGAEVRIHDQMMELTIRAVSRALFGRLAEGKEVELAQAIDTLSESLQLEITSIFKLPEWLPLPHIERIRAARALLHGYIDETIARRRAGEAGDDLLGIILSSLDEQGDGRGMSDYQAHSEAVTMFVAGHHTTAACLSWTLYLLSQHPEWVRRIREEAAERFGGGLPAAADSGKLFAATMVLKESMRLYPPAWALFCREPIEDIELGGYTIPRGSWCFFYPWVLHADPRFFPEPERFDPERFLPEREAQLPAGAYIPFGLGGRSCIGQKMSMAAMEQMLPLLVRGLDFALAPGQGTPEPEATISLRPKGDIRMVVRPAAVPARVHSRVSA
jgi:cytochrome P450